MVVVVEVCIAQRQALDPLAQPRQQRVLEEFGMAMVLEAGGQALPVTRGAVPPGQEHPAVTGGPSAVHTHRHGLGGELRKGRGLRRTRCIRGAAGPIARYLLPIRRLTAFNPTASTHP